MRFILRSALACLTLCVGAPPSAHAAEPLPIHDAVQQMHGIDARGQWFSMAINLVGIAPGTTLATLALVDREPLSLSGTTPLSSGSALLMIATAGGLVVHGFMRIDERQASAATSAELLADPALMKAAGRLYLADRARKARATRFMGGLLTTAHSLGMAGLGTAELLADDGNAGLGYGLLAAGVIGIGIGSIHFFGDPRPAKILKRTEATARWSPTLVGTDRALAPGLGLSGRF